MNTYAYEMFSEIYGCFSFTLQALYTSFNLIEMFENLNEILPPTDAWENHVCMAREFQYF